MTKRYGKARYADDWTFRPAALPETVREKAIKARTPEDVAAMVPELAMSAQEAFLVVDLNAKNNVIDKRLVSLGLLDASLVHPREIFRGAISNSAAAIICIHNHPSGDPTPSAEDIRITRQLVEAGRIIDIRVLDHIIIGRKGDLSVTGFVSMRESGLVEFK